MKIIGVIPARYKSSRFPGKPLADICGKPMVWWVYQQVSKVKEIDEVYVATDDERIKSVCEQFNINVIMTSTEHDTPTSRIYEVSERIKGDRYVFVGGDEPLIDSIAIKSVVLLSKENDYMVTHAMTKIKTAPEVIDFTNIKVVVNTNNQLLYVTRSPIPYPKGGLDYEYKKFVGIASFKKEALDFYNDTPKTDLERIEECDLIRFLEKRIPVQMVEVLCSNISVDTIKDIDKVRNIIFKGANNVKDS